MSFDPHPSPPPAGAADALLRARHDLGKYVAFACRCLPEVATDAELREALTSDLLYTRSNPPAGCAEVWAGLRPELHDAGVDVAALDAAVAGLAARAGRLAALDRAALLATVAEAVSLGDALRALHRQAVAAGGGA